MAKHRRSKKRSPSSKATMKAFKKWKTKIMKTAPKSIRGCTAILALRKSKCVSKRRLVKNRK